MGCHVFSCRSLLLSTTILNDIVLKHNLMNMIMQCSRIYVKHQAYQYNLQSTFCISEKATGRIIDYKSKSLATMGLGLSGYSFVSFDHAKSIWMYRKTLLYREIVFAFSSKFDSAVTTHHGLITQKLVKLYVHCRIVRYS